MVRIRTEGVREPPPESGTMANAFVCRVELSKTDGITVKLTDDAGKVTQSIEMDGKTITTTFKGQKKTSTITQKDESIVIKVTGDKGTSTITQNEEEVTVKVKEFTVDAETILMKSSKDSTYESKDKLTVKSTKAMTLDSKATLAAKSTQAMSLTSKNALKASAKAALSGEGLSVALTGKTKVAITSKGQAELGAAKVSVKGKAMAEVKAPTTQVGQNLTTIKGQMVQVSGAMVKLG